MGMMTTNRATTTKGVNNNNNNNKKVFVLSGASQFGVQRGETVSHGLRISSDHPLQELPGSPLRHTSRAGVP